MLSQPVDLHIGVQLAQLVGDRHVPLSVAQTDRRGDVQHAPGTCVAPDPSPGRLRRKREVTQQQVDLDRVTYMRAVARALEQDEVTAGRFGERDPATWPGDRVVRPLDHQNWAADPAGQLT